MAIQEEKISIFDAEGDKEVNLPDLDFECGTQSHHFYRVDHGFW